MGGIRLDSPAGAFGKGDSGRPTITPGSSVASELIRRIAATDKNLRMPLGGSPVPAPQVQMLRAWIDAGAQWPESSAGTTAGNPKPSEMRVTDRDRQHWSFRPLSRAEPPRVRNTSWPKNSIDRFILAAIEAKDLSPVPVAAKEKLIRRLYFTVAGLPPGPDDIRAFENDRSPEAYQRLVDRLLDSPRFGERWARHWLDIARYADSEGYNRDADRPLLYKYRDFVIRAMNDDMPFDQFVRWQIAGDEYEPDNPDALVATGFIASGPREYPMVTDTEENKLQYIYDELDDMVSTTSQAMLGLTVGCARCHDHKFDPLPTRDYYSLTAAFRNFHRQDTYVSRAHREWEQWLASKRAALREEKIQTAGIDDEGAKIALRAPLEKNNSGQVFFYKKYDAKLQFTEEEFQAWLTPEDREEQGRLMRAVAKAELKFGKEPPKAFAIVDSRAEPVDSFLLGRGSVTNKKEKIGFGFLTVLMRGREPEQYRQAVLNPDVRSTFQRSAIAEWLVDVEHGAGALLARVIVNRLWQHHFGEGLVRTPNDFGVQGDTPSHPELLDWLANELVRSGWRLKAIHRLILNSAVYQLSAHHDANIVRVDPDNRLLARRRPFRLEAEALRDSILAVSGALNYDMYGPAVRPYIPAEATLTRSKDKWPKDVVEGPNTWRRTIYVFAKRSVRYPWLETFDAPDGVTSCGRRVPTTVPTQALNLLNDPFVRQQARHFAARVTADASPGSSAEKVRRAYQLAFGRTPKSSELDRALTFLNQADPGAALVDFCHALFTSNEFMYID
jgi:hypothetical protein